MAVAVFVANDMGNWQTRATVPTVLTAPIKLSLHTADPGVTGASEASGGTYARVAAGYAAAVAGVNALAATISFTGLPAGTFTYAGIWDSHATVPKFIMGAILAASQTVGAGATIQLTAASVTNIGT